MDRLRHFIRHGKAALSTPTCASPSVESQGSPMTLSAAQVTPAKMAGATAEPRFSSPAGSPQSIRDSPVQQAKEDVEPSPHQNTQSIHRQLEQIVAQERREASASMPRYEGLPERFELVEKLGDGTFSMVYKAKDHQTGQMVAVKIVRKHEVANKYTDRLDPSMREQHRATERDTIMKEVQIMRRLKHDSIVQLISFTESPEHCFLVMELLSGGELFEQIVKLTYLSEPLARHVILQVAHGIRFMHEECGIVHRDIKPENLLFEPIDFIPSQETSRRPYDEDKADEGVFRPGIGGGGIGKVKIADFGLSKIIWEKNTKTPCGTVGYAAPEIVRDEHYSKSVDMWALGCVLYTLLCGFPPFYDESIKALTEKVSKGQYTFLSPWWDDISDSAKDLVSNLLTVDVKKRFTIDQFLNHEWCRQGAPSGEGIPIPHSAENAHAKSKYHQDGALLSPLLTPHWQDSQKARGERSANAYRLREAFDVSFAVHRVEEEMRQRLRVSPEDRRDSVWRPINDNRDDARGDVVNARHRYGKDAAHAIAERHHAHSAHIPQQSKPKDTKPFNLNLEGATILERRKRAQRPEDRGERLHDANRHGADMAPYTVDALVPIPQGAA